MNEREAGSRFVQRNAAQWSGKRGERGTTHFSPFSKDACNEMDNLIHHGGAITQVAALDLDGPNNMLCGY
ncbi:hypothetical protein CEXT_406601 [Caerostris extrusa]|uniref:Uncharacterized protein n=1 Tax=Caerostris extrusa TaxID=172846 RepID=A0AAV4S121_CAEEX|nr:hypothetical protein CEXT_406601 [Caerostris extrusa]